MEILKIEKSHGYVKKKFNSLREIILTESKVPEKGIMVNPCCIEKKKKIPKNFC